MSNDYNAVIIGAGGAGLAAAAMAAEAGCTVLVLEAEAKIGGSTAMSHGVFSAADTHIQRALGFTDSVDAYFNYYMSLNRWRPPAALIRTFCENSTPTLEWLISLGVEFPTQMAPKRKGAVWPTGPDGPGLYASGVESPPRGHMPTGNGKAYIDALDQRCAALGVEVVVGTRVQKLLVEGGRVVGVEADGQPVRSAAVAITCGGFGHDQDFIREYMPAAMIGVLPGEIATTISAPGARGDNIRLGRQGGALISGHDCGLVVQNARIRRRPGMAPFLGYQPTSIIYVGRSGRRFGDESLPYAVMPGLIQAQGGLIWGIFDEAARLAADPMKTEWSSDFILQCVAHGDFQCAPTLTELADKCRIGAEGLAISVAHYNEDLPGGRDRAFLRDLHGLRPIAQPPFYAFEYALSGAHVTGAGVTIDPDCHALDEDGAIVPGLYAAGEASAGILGENYVGGGNSIANALTMGRLAGMTIGREVRTSASN